MPRLRSQTFSVDKQDESNIEHGPADFYQDGSTLPEIVETKEEENLSIP